MHEPHLVNREGRRRRERKGGRGMQGKDGREDNGGKGMEGEGATKGGKEGER